MSSNQRFKDPQFLADGAALLSHVALGDQDQAELLLRREPSLLLYAGPVTDAAGRSFKNITPFQYAVWALDVRYMTGMMFACLPHEKKAHERFMAMLCSQYDELEKNGVIYTLGADEHQDKHYDLSPLIAALSTYVETFALRTNEQREVLWCTVVGGLQCLVPAHVAQHYCDPDEAFIPTPTFEKPVFHRTLQVYDYWEEKQYAWWSEGLGKTFAIFRAPWGAVGGGQGRGGEQEHYLWFQESAQQDKNALEALNQARLADLKQLSQRLHQ